MVGLWRVNRFRVYSRLQNIKLAGWNHTWVHLDKSNWFCLSGKNLAVEQLVKVLRLNNTASNELINDWFTFEPITGVKKSLRFTKTLFKIRRSLTCIVKSPNGENPVVIIWNFVGGFIIFAKSLPCLSIFISTIKMREEGFECLPFGRL